MQETKQQEKEDWIDKAFFEDVICPKCDTQRTEKYKGKHMCNVCGEVF